MANLVPSEKDLLNSINLKMPDITITIQDLKKPTSEFVIDYFRRVLEEFAPQEINLNHIPFLHLREFCPNSPTINLYFALDYIYKKLFVDNFSLKDLIEPNYKRTLTLIHSFDNFHNYANVAMDDVNEIVKEHQSLEEKSKDLENYIEHYKTNNNQNISYKAQLQNQSKEISQKKSEASIKIKQLLKEKETLKKLQENRSKNIDNLNELKKLHEQMVHKNNDLKKKIMPKKSEIESNLSELKREYDEINQRTKESLTILQKEKETINENNLNLYQRFKTNTEIYLENLKADLSIKQDYSNFNSSIIQTEIISLEKENNFFQEEMDAFKTQMSKKNRSLIEYFKDVVMTAKHSESDLEELNKKEQNINIALHKKNYNILYSEVKNKSDILKRKWDSILKEEKQNSLIFQNVLIDLEKYLE